MKNKYVLNYSFVHHARFHYIMTPLKWFFKTEIESLGEIGLDL